MVVQHNMQALNANRMLGITTKAQAKSTEKLSSGYKINRAADDAAGLSISEKMRKQIKGLDQASTNAQDGISAVQTAEGALTEVHSMLQRMNELAVQAANGTNSETDRQSIQDEIEQLTTEIDRVAETTKFNEAYLLKGNGKNTTVKIDAKDAGIDGRLTGVGTGSAKFTMDALKTGEQIVIGSKGYTIGSGVSVIQDKIEAAEDGAKVTINGTAYTITAGEEDATENLLSKATLKTLVSDGDKVVIGSDKYVAMVDGGAATADDVKAAITKAGLGNGKSITIDGATYTITADDNTVVAPEIADVDYVLGELNDSGVITIGTTGYTTGTANAETDIKALTDGATVVMSDGTTITLGTSITNTPDYLGTLDAIAAAVMKDGAVVSFTDDKGTTTTVTMGETNITNDGVGDNDASVISAEKAFELIREELEWAGSVGADPGSEATAAGTYDAAATEWVFDITEGSVETTQGLQFTLHVGADADESNKIALTIDAMDSTSLGVSGINVVDNTGAKATYAIDSIADAIAKVSAQRSELGAIQNRLEHTIANLDNVVENTTAAESEIRDTDMAEQMVDYSKNNILMQAGQSMLTQANQATQGVLSLLG